MHIQRKQITTHPSGKEIFEVEMANENGIRVRMTNYGNIIHGFYLKGINIVLGFEDVREYLSPAYQANYPYFGCVIGRTANRIKDGRFSLDGKVYQLAQNLGGDNLHGGPEGFDKKVWDILAVEDGPEPSVRLGYESLNGDAQFPGKLQVQQEYKLTENNELVIRSFAETDAPTPVNLTHHDYFNLNGEGSILGHRVQIFSSRYLGQDEQLVADGRKVPVFNTPYDFTKSKPVGRDLGSYDQSFLIDGYDRSLRLAARAEGEKTGFILEVLTTEPVVHMYTGSGIPVMEIKGAKLFGPSTGICFETQKEPNAINIPAFTNTVLRPGEVYQETTVFRLKEKN